MSDRENTIKQNTIELVRQAVRAVTKRNIADKAPDAPLQLDSIERIALLVELENRFRIEIDSSALLPEAFESLTSLAKLMDEVRLGV